MRRTAVLLGLALTAAFFSILLPAAAGRSGSAARQESVPPQVQKPRYDYNSTFLNSRSTRPLGLKEDPAVRKMLGQGPVKWAIRAGIRQILD